MISAPVHPDESARLQDLIRLEVLDTEDEAAFDDITQLASIICGTNISLISLIDSDRQWFKSRVGLGAEETGRDIAFCSHAILQEHVFEVSDTLEDNRFSDNPLVTDDPNIRFYAGAPLVTDNGFPIGTLCVIDQDPKTLTADQTLALKTLAKQVISQLELRLHNRQLARMQKEQEQLLAMMAHDLRSPFNGILGLSRILHEKSDSVTPERVQAMSSSILESSIKVYQLLDELLQWSRNRLGAVTVSLDTVSVEKLTLETIEFMQEAFKYKQLTVQQDVASDLFIQADASLTKTVIRNLLANAIKYSPESSHITVSAKQNGDNIELSVTDQGKGVSPEKIKLLFIDRMQSTEGTSGETGFGIGLNICHDFTKKQNGDIWLNKDYTQGAQFIISLPATPGDG
jgi:signal transduction histidine kinase